MTIIYMYSTYLWGSICCSRSFTLCVGVCFFLSCLYDTCFLATLVRALALAAARYRRGVLMRNINKQKFGALVVYVFTMCQCGYAREWCARRDASAHIDFVCVSRAHEASTPAASARVLRSLAGWSALAPVFLRTAKRRRAPPADSRALRFSDNKCLVSPN